MLVTQPAGETSLGTGKLPSSAVIVVCNRHRRRLRNRNRTARARFGCYQDVACMKGTVPGHGQRFYCHCGINSLTGTIRLPFARFLLFFLMRHDYSHNGNNFNDSHVKRSRSRVITLETKDANLHYFLALKTPAILSAKGRSVECDHFLSCVGRNASPGVV